MAVGGANRLTDGSSSPMARLAYSPDEVAQVLGISRELVNDLLRTGQLHSISAGRRRLVSKYHLAAFLGVPETSITAA